LGDCRDPPAVSIDVIAGVATEPDPAIIMVMPN